MTLLTVDDWMLSEKKFHVMRDHPSHSRYAMSGGMWGGIHEAMPNMRSLILNQDKPSTFLKDIDFLNRLLDISMIVAYLYVFNISIIFRGTVIS
jgi:hypothetical protein